MLFSRTTRCCEVDQGILGTLFATVHHYSHHWRLFAQLVQFAIRNYSLFATVSYSLFEFSKHSTQPPDFAISSFSPFLIHSKLKCFSVYLCTFSPPNLLSREFFQKPCSGSDTKDRNFPSDTGIKPRLLNQTSLAQYSSKISFCKQSKTKTNCLLAH